MTDITQLFNTQAEEEVIAACISDVNIYDALSENLSEELFSTTPCQQALSIIKAIVKDGKKPDYVEFGMRLSAAGGDITRFMLPSMPSYSLTNQRVELLRGLARKRSLYTLCCEGIRIATDPTADVADFQKIITGLSDASAGQTEAMISFRDTVKTLREAVVSRMSGHGEQGIMTGLHVFDTRMGFHQGDLVIIAGETSQGKSTLATTIARNVALQKIPCAYYSLEMGANQLTARLLARDVLITSSRLLYDKLNDSEYSQLYDVSEKLSGLPIYFDERSKTSFEKMCSSIRAMVRRYGIKIAFIDYLQILANSATANNREQLIADIAREFKRIAVEENICIVLLSQLSRDPSGHEPTMSRLRGSGQIEEAADVVILVYRPSVYGIATYPNGTSTADSAKLIIAKGRNIGLGEDIVAFNSELTFFSDFTPEQALAKVEQERRTWNGSLPF